MHDQTPTPPRLFRVSFDMLVGHGVTATTPQVTPITEDFPAEDVHPISTSFGLLAGYALTDGRYDSETDPTGRYTTLATHEVLRGLLDAMDTADTDSDTPDTP